MNPAIPIGIFENTSHAVMISDVRGRVSFCNHAAATLLRSSPGRAIGNRCWNVARFRTCEGLPFCSPDCAVQRSARAGRREFAREIRLGFAGTGLRRFELLSFALSRPDGIRRSVLHIVIPQRGARGVVEAVLGETGAGGGGKLNTLSRREFQVLQLLATGAADTRIAAALCISPITVRNHVQNILRKFGVHRRVDAVLLMLRESF